LVDSGSVNIRARLNTTADKIDRSASGDKAFSCESSHACHEQDCFNGEVLSNTELIRRRLGLVA